jgi:uncharacterized membrane protein YgcG
LLNAPLPQCAQCGLSLADLDRKFGIVPLYSRYLTDRTERLSLRDAQQLRQALGLFQKKFPQLLFSVMLIDLHPPAPISEYAFWLINRARFSEFQATGAKNLELLLVIDTGVKEAALITGYGLESYLAEEDLTEALNAARPGLGAGDLANAIGNCIDFIARRLREIAMHTEAGQAETGSEPVPEPATETP